MDRGPAPPDRRDRRRSAQRRAADAARSGSRSSPTWAANVTAWPPPSPPSPGRRWRRASLRPRTPAARRRTTPVATEAGVAMLQGSWADGRLIVWGGGPGRGPDRRRRAEGAAGRRRRRRHRLGTTRRRAPARRGQGRGPLRTDRPDPRLAGRHRRRPGRRPDRLPACAGWAMSPCGAPSWWPRAAWSRCCGARLAAASHGGGPGPPPGPVGAGPGRPGPLRRPGGPHARRRGRRAGRPPGRRRLPGRCSPPSSTPSPEPAPSAVPSPAALPHATSRVEVSEAVLAGLDGRSFSAEADVAARLADDLKRWAAPVATATEIGLTVRLDPPADDGGWLLHVEATGVDKAPLPVEHALVVASGTKSEQVEAQLRRLGAAPARPAPAEHPAGPGDRSTREEASELMFTTGPTLAAAGFEVYLPARLRAGALAPAAVVRRGDGRPVPGRRGAAVQRCAGRSSSTTSSSTPPASPSWPPRPRPLVQVKGRWVHIDRADLVAAAAALAERASITQLSGAALIRHAVGLEGGALGRSGPRRRQRLGRRPGPRRHLQPAGPLEAPDRVQGHAAPLPGRGRRVAGLPGPGRPRRLPGHGHGPRQDPDAAGPPPRHPGRRARRWSSARPPCSATGRRKPARFTPTLSVVSHHGPRRAGRPGLGRLAGTADVVLTTYATAVRDIDALAGIDWRRVVVDEAQAIKNHTSETAQALRRLPARAAWPSPAPRSRTASVTCGPSSTSPTPAWSAAATRSSSRCRGRRRSRLRPRG